jgi:hypothetical protein
VRVAYRMCMWLLVGISSEWLFMCKMLAPCKVGSSMPKHAYKDATGCCQPIFLC